MGSRAFRRRPIQTSLNRGVSRRVALSSMVKIVGLAASSFVAGGLIGYWLGPGERRVITETKTIVKTLMRLKLKPRQLLRPRL